MTPDPREQEVEAVAQAMWEGLKGAHPGDVAALTLEDAARKGIAALDRVRGPVLTKGEAVALLAGGGYMHEDFESAVAKLRQIAERGEQ